MGDKISKASQAESKPTGSWECLVDGGKWATYDAPNNTIIEAAFDIDSPTVMIRRGKWEYTIDFVAMTQTNTTTGVSRAIRRDGLQATASGGGGVGGGGSPVNDKGARMTQSRTGDKLFYCGRKGVALKKSGTFKVQHFILYLLCLMRSARHASHHASSS